MKKIRVMHLLASNQFSGAENVVCQIIKLFCSDDRFEMIYVSPNGLIQKALDERNVPNKLLDKFSVFEVRKILEQWEPTVIHAHDRKAIACACVVAKHKVKVIGHIHNDFLDMKRITFGAIACRYYFRKLEHIFWVSNSSFKSYIFRKNISSKSTVLRNIIDKNLLYLKAMEDKNNYLYDLIFIGRVTEQKNPLRWVNIVDMVRQKYPEIRSAIVGGGDLEEKVKRQICDLKLEKNLHYFGYLNNPYKILEQSKILLMTSVNEGTPMVALEAMAFGKPIISTPVGGLNDLICDGQTGYLSNRNEVLCEKISLLLSDHELYERFSKSSEERFNNINNLEKYKNTLEEEYIRSNVL